MDRMISAGLLNLISKLIKTNDIKALKEMGFNGQSIEIISAADIVDQELISAALAKSMYVSINADKFIEVLSSGKKINAQQELLHKFIVAGASYEMCRHFFDTHTNRKHTDLRSMLAVSNNTVLYAKNNIDQHHLNEVLYKVEQANKKISAQDLFYYHQQEKVSLLKVYRGLLDYLEHKEK